VDILDKCKEITLPTDCCKPYCGIAFDGCHFYLTMPRDCSICKFDKDFKPLDCIKTDRPYRSISYDSIEQSFWVSVNSDKSTIFKLDGKFREIDLIKLKCCLKPSSQIMGISFNCAQNTLFVAYRDAVVEVSKDGECRVILGEPREGNFVSVLSIAPYLAVVKKDDKKQEIIVYTCKGCIALCFRVPNEFFIRDIVFNPCVKRCGPEHELIILATKHCCYPRVLRCGIKLCDNLCRCIFDICRDCREDDKDKEKCACDLIKSVALVEAALSHILNAEGEKLQKAIEIAGSVEELLCINKSINRIIINTTHLEQVLYAKLDTLNNLGLKCPEQKQNEHEDDC